MGTHDVTMDAISALCKRRGFIFQGSEIYDGLAGTWDYGPWGVILKNNIKALWWKQFVEMREDVFGIDAAIIMNSKTWEASGHVEGFSDPLVEDTKTKKRYRADHLLEEAGIETGGLGIDEMETRIKEHAIQSPEGHPLGPVRQFNMMFATHIGATDSGESTVYLRPETAQGIFVNFKNIVDTMNPKIPFGIAQIGKAFRNEIAPRDFIFRTREFEQMEVEYFVRPNAWEEAFEMLRASVHSFIGAVGIDVAKVSERDIPHGERAHYSKKTIDFEFEFPFGKKELYGLAYRGDYDLSHHASHSKKNLEYFDQEKNERFIPHVIEPSFGLDRTVLAVLASAYTVDTLGGDTRTYLRLTPQIAPVQVAVFPLLKNKPELVARAKRVYEMLKTTELRVRFDDNGNIGKRYRRQDEIGTPYTVTIDFETLGTESVTVRDRDTGDQKRILCDALESELRTRIETD